MLIRSTSVEVASARANAGSAYAATTAAAAAAAAAAATANGPHKSPEQQHHEEKQAPVEMWILLKLILPLLITNFAQALLPITSFIYAGRLTDAATIAGLGLGISICNITGVCIYYGMGTGIELMCAQSFGARNNRAVGVAFARCTLLTTVLFVPVAFLWWYMEWVLLHLGQQPNIAHITGTFSRAYLLGMVPYAVFENLKRCLQAQNVGTPIMNVALLGMVANVVFHHVTMAWLGMGVYGAGLALSMTGVFLLVTLVTYTWTSSLGGQDCWSGLCTEEVFQKLPAFLWLCIPGLLSVFIEWTSMEASTFLAGLVGERELATQIMILSAYAIFGFQFALSISIGANIRVGNLLGEGNAEGARKASRCGVRLALIAAALAALGMGLGRAHWPRLYGVPEDVLDMIVDLTPFFVGAQFIDMVQNVCTGILKGMGYQLPQAIAAGFAFWVVGVPLSWYLGVHLNWGVKGLWGAMAIAEGPLFVVYLFLLGTADWQQCVEKAAERVRRHSQTSAVDTDQIPLAALAAADYSDSMNSTDSATNDTDSSSSSFGSGIGAVPLRRGGSGAAAAAAAATPADSSDSSDYDEEASFGYYGSDGGEMITRGVSSGARAELSAARVAAAAAIAGERSKLLFAAPGPPRRGVSTGSASSYCSSVEGSIV